MTVPIASGYIAMHFNVVKETGFPSFWLNPIQELQILSCLEAGAVFSSR